MKQLKGLTALILISLTGCQASTELEPIYGFKVNAKVIEISVKSTGCTDVYDFTYEIEDGKLTLERVKPDNCRRMPFKKEITLTLLEEYPNLEVLNPLAEWP